MLCRHCALHFRFFSLLPQLGIALAFLPVGYFPVQEAEVSIRLVCKHMLVLAAAAMFVAGAVVGGQQTFVEEGKRKAKTKVSPIYPELARRMNISGKVKLEVVIAPDGRVKNARAVGGHPVLIQPCLDAVKEWRFDPAPEETTQIIEFNFKD